MIIIIYSYLVIYIHTMYSMFISLFILANKNGLFCNISRRYIMLVKKKNHKKIKIDKTE